MFGQDLTTQVLMVSDPIEVYNDNGQVIGYETYAVFFTPESTQAAISVERPVGGNGTLPASLDISTSTETTPVEASLFSSSSLPIVAIIGIGILAAIGSIKKKRRK